MRAKISGWSVRSVGSKAALVLLAGPCLCACSGDVPSGRNADSSMLDAGSMPLDAKSNADAAAPLVSCAGSKGTRFESFDVDPEWDGLRNREPRPCPTTEQGFGFSDTSNAGSGRGEIGGLVSSAAASARYGRAIEMRTLSDRFEASGRIAVQSADNGGVLFGWYNTNSAGWRTNNSLVMRIDGSNDADVHIEYATQFYGANAAPAVEGVDADGEPHTWALSYDPDANDGVGRIQLVWDGVDHFLDLLPEHRTAGAAFNRFGILNQQIPGGTATLYFDDVVVDGVTERFNQDPSWESIDSRRTYDDCERPPWHHYGYASDSDRIGGVLWRADVGEPKEFTYYADRIGPLAATQELCMEGTVSLTRASTDSGVMLGWFSAADEARNTERFVGALIGGPSRVGHYFRPSALSGAPDDGPIILPDRAAHRFVMRYRPNEDDGGEIELLLGEARTTFTIQRDPSSVGRVFDRFGILGAQPSGQFLEVFFDDLRYTAGRE